MSATSIEVEARGGSGARTAVRADGRVVALLVAGLALLAVPYLLLGPGWLLDDWWSLRNTAFGSWASAAGASQWRVRPGAGLVYGLFFGIIERPAWVFVVQTGLNAGVAVAGFLLLRRLVSRPLAVAVVVAWMLLPNHTTMDYWASAGNITLALLLALLGCLALAGPPGRWRVAVAIVSFVGSVLSYEATFPFVAAAAIGVPAVVQRRLVWRPTAGVWAALGAAGVWILLHWNPRKPIATTTQDLTPLFAAHFEWGVVPSGVGRLSGLVVVAYLVFAFVATTMPSYRRLGAEPERVALVGVGVVVLGVVPFVRYGYQPLGLGDRVNVVSSLGAALVWGAFAVRIWRWWRPIGVVAVALVAVLMLWVRYERAAIYARAGEDAVVVLDALADQHPEPRGPVLVGPGPLICQNIVSFFDHENIGPAYQRHMGDRRFWARVSTSEAEWRRASGTPRLDQEALRPASARCEPPLSLP